MDSPFSRIGRNYPSRAVPVNHVFGKAPAKKVVTIPVHFVGSERTRSEPDAAVKIQKLFRGYRVRKSVRRILEIRKEVNEIEKRVPTEEYKEVIRKQSKERLKVNEMLMSMLFKLDSVNSVDAGVRDLRKTVIKKAIALQERVDSIATGQAAGNLTPGESEAVDQAGEVQEDELKPPEDTVQNTDAADQTTEAVGDNWSSFEDVADRLGNETNAVDQMEDVEDATNQSREVAQDNLNSLDNVVEPMGEEASCPSEVIAGDNMEKGDVEDDNVDDVSECGENVEMSQMESQAHSSSNLCPMVEEDEDVNHEEDDIDGGHCEMVEKQEDGGLEKEVTGAKECNAGEEKREEGKRSRDREMLERMVEDNGRMMELMAELFERNEIQTKILSSLSQRVEMLERALLCSKLRRKKMKNNALVDCLESTQDSKKCGKKWFEILGYLHM